MCTSSRNYQDILAPRRAECSNFMWASRAINPQIAFAQARKPSPQYHKTEVLGSPKIQELLLKLSRQQNVPIGILETHVKHILDEIGYNKKLKVIRWLGLVLAKICLKICSGIYLNEDSILSLKSQMGTCPVIFVPSHRSYADFILMSAMCFSEEIAVPAIAAGMDFHGMWGMGSVLRDTGAFFMRRSYNDDSLYWATFKQYVYQIVTKGELPIEFFIEGTRSRSNKSLVPKYGLILMILKAFFLSQVPDILFVPINISYDRILEEKLFAFELLGIPKPKETTSRFFKSLSIVKEKYGAIYFDIGRPISAREFFAGRFDPTAHNSQPVYQQEITEEEKKLIPALAHEIVYRQQKHCVITTFNLLAIILHNNLSNMKDLLGVDAMAGEIVWLKQAIGALGGFVHMNDVTRDLMDALQVHKNIVGLDGERKITLIWDDVVQDKIKINKLKAHELSDKTITFAVPFIMLQIYINPVLHYLIDVGVLVLVLRNYKALSEDELFGHYHFLRTLLSQDFVTFHTREKMEFEVALERAIALNLVAKNQFYELGENQKLQEVVCSCFGCFILTYFLVCMVLLRVLSRVIDEKTILAKVQDEVEARLEEDASPHPYSLSLDTISNCLQSLTSQKVLSKSTIKNSIWYEIHDSDLLMIKNKLEKYVPPAQILQGKLKHDKSVQLHLKNKL